MLSFISIQVLSLVYLILILCVFLYKKNSRNLEGVMYEVLLLLTMIVVLFDVASNIMIYQNPEGVLTNIIGKSYLIMCILWCFWLTIYVSNINIGKEYKTIKELFKGETILKWTSLLTALLASGVLFLNSNYIVDEVTNASFQNGPAVYYTYLVTDNNTFAIVKNEIVLQKDMNAIFIYKDGLIHSTINKIDFDKKRLKIGKVYLSEKSDIMAVGVNNLYTLPGLNDNEEDEGDFYG